MSEPLMSSRSAESESVGRSESEDSQVEAGPEDSQVEAGSEDSQDEVDRSLLTRSCSVWHDEAYLGLLLSPPCEVLVARQLVRQPELSSPPQSKAPCPQLRMEPTATTASFCAAPPEPPFSRPLHDASIPPVIIYFQYCLGERASEPPRCVHCAAGSGAGALLPHGVTHARAGGVSADSGAGFGLHGGDGDTATAPTKRRLEMQLRLGRLLRLRLQSAHAELPPASCELPHDASTSRPGRLRPSHGSE
ncbi:hypothetical protein ON010_g8712 [Phytophthora cinnamomi]|nr:hypothetical protein ON010_g8712 [Phytophthora cinnamomi]